MKDSFAKIPVLEERMKNLIDQNSKEHADILCSITQINNKLDDSFVSKSEWEPYKRLIWLVSGVIVAGITTAVLGQIVK